MIEGIMIGIISGVAAAVAFAVLSLVYERIAKTARTVLRLEHHDLFGCEGIRLRLLHCWNDDGQCVNRIYQPRLENGKTWSVRVVRPKHLGFQYKWFVEYSLTWSEQEVIKALEGVETYTLDVGAGQPNRIWIEDASQPRAPDPRDPGSINNQFFPV